MERNYPAAGFGDLGSGTGWSYDRSAKASLMYGSARSSHHDSELLHRQAYGSPHPLQGYATNHHPGGLSGLFDAGLHHSGPSGPDPSVMNLISALDSRGPQPPPSASSLLTQFRTPSWQTAMHSPAPTELFISGALPGSASFSSSSSALSAYQHPGSFSGRSFTPSLSLQDTAAFSPNSNGLLSPHDPLMHIKTPSQSSLGFDRLLSSQSSAYRSSQELAAPPPSHVPPSSSSCHLPPPQFNLLSSQLHNQSSQLYNASMFSSTPALIATAPAQDRTLPRQDSVIKHYQRSPPAHSATLPPQQYLSCAGSVGYQQLPSQHHHAGVSYSPSGEQSPPSDPKRSPQAESRPYRPNIKTPYASSSSSSASSSSAETKESESSTTGYSSNSVSSSSRASHTPPLSSKGSSSPSNPKGSASAPKPCLSTYGSPPGAKSSTSLSGQTPPQQQAQSYSPDQLAPTPGTQSCFSSPKTCDMSSGAGGNGGKAFADLGAGGRSFSAEIVFGDSSFSSAPHRRAESPSPGYGTAAGSTGSGASAISTLETGLGSVASGSGVASGGSTSYRLNESSPSPAVTSTVPHPGLRSPASARPAQSPGGSGAGTYLPSMLSPTFMASSRNPTETQQPYRPAAPKTKTQANMLGVERSQMEEADDFLIQQLLHTQSSTSHSAQHHPSSLQMPQQLPLAGDTEAKGATYDMNKISDERHHLHSVIRANSATGAADPDTSMSKVTGGLKSQLEISRKETGANITEGDGVAGERHGQQHGLPSHHLGRQTAPELHGFLPEPDLALPTGSHLHHVNQSQSHAHHRQQAHSHHQPSHTHLAHPQSHQMVGNIGTGQQLHQSQARETDHQPSHSQLDRLKPPHHFDTVSPGGKTRLNPNQQQEQFTSLTSICFSDSLLNDEDRTFFPGVEDMFCSANYKSSCAGDSGSGQASQESIPQGRGQEGMEVLKTGDAGQGYGLVAHHGDQGYGQYCHSLSGLGNTTLNADLDSMKTHDLPSTVNTDQLGLIQSQAPTMGSNPTAQDSVNKMTASVGVVGGPSNTALTAAIFCSSRPKKLLKTSSFHLLKQRREPQPLAKKNYAQEYEFEDDEDKADGPADIRLNSRRLPDLLPDLVSSCRKSSGASAVGGLGPLMGDVDFCHPSGYSSLGQSQPLLAQDGPKKRGRKPTKPKREGPPRPRGRPRIRPLPEPSYCRGLMGSAAGESRRGRGRGRGRGRREEASDSLSGTDPALSDGSMGSAASLGPSPGPSSNMDIGRKELNQTQDKMHHDISGEMMWKKEMEDPLTGFMSSFLDFLKTGKKQPGLEPLEDRCDTHPSLKGGIRPITPTAPLSPPPPQPQPAGTFGEERAGPGADLALSSCPSPCKPLDDELKGNLEALPSFSSDEEDSVSKNQDLQKSISSAISALYDTPHPLAAAVACAVVKVPSAPSPPSPREPALSAAPAPAPPSASPSVSPTPPSSSSPSPLPPPEAGRASPSSPSSPSTSSPSPPCSPPPSPPTPEEAPASQRLAALHLAKKQADAAIAGQSEEEDSESGGEGIFRERDEFVIRTEDIGTLKMALQTGREPPPIWRVQKALLQKFSPEIKDGQRQFCATSNYLGYFGDAKMRYQRLYVKFLENVNKKDYVRVCSRKPWHRTALTLRRQSLPKQLATAHNPTPPGVERDDGDKEKEPKEKKERDRREKAEKGQKERQRKEKVEREKRETEKRERERRERCGRERETAEKGQRNEPKDGEKEPDKTASLKGERERSDDRQREAERDPKESEKRSEEERPLRLGLNSRAMREMFRSYVEMLVSTALDPDMIRALEDTDDELYLPPMRKIDSLLNERKKRLLRRVGMSAQHQEALQIFPKMTADALESGTVKVRLNGEGYNRKTLNRGKRSIPKQQDLKLSLETCRVYSLYHSLHHYKYHTFLHCKKETASIEQAADDPGQEEVVQQCMANHGWLESLFDSFMELLGLGGKA
uniref:Proline rich 12 n=1 Tax=Hippocampus comes TaxID=109280 RepID=A0A3Q2XUA6_HIPCM